MWTCSGLLAMGTLFGIGLASHNGWLILGGLAGIIVLAICTPTTTSNSPSISDPGSTTLTPNLQSLSSNSAAPAPNRHSPSASVSTREQAAYKRLIVMAHGDHALAQRLINYEARRTPSAGRTSLIESAIDRWIRDNR